MTQNRAHDLRHSVDNIRLLVVWPDKTVMDGRWPAGIYSIFSTRKTSVVSPWEKRSVRRVSLLQWVPLWCTACPLHQPHWHNDTTMAVGLSQSLAQRSGTVSRISSGTRQSALTLSDVYWRRICLCNTSACSALEVDNFMRYINLLTYLLTMWQL